MNDKNEQKIKFQKRLRFFVVRLVKFLNHLRGDPGLRDINRQLIRSGTSIGANYFEAIGASFKA